MSRLLQLLYRVIRTNTIWWMAPVASSRASWLLKNGQPWCRIVVSCHMGVLLSIGLVACYLLLTTKRNN
ncbi:hypothetical protein [Noviherbaspirillum aridicola]|uniref:hypothetical protein n=1 Tax=Noviherbaspirillum aridicola TaxID=2849687 RepID=UPI001C80E3ED|nr:hypothetical protein [Noviherbaspirillum aridicola]